MRDNLSRIKWACRRGMLELDVVLNHFLAHAYAQLPEVEKEAFRLALGLPDPELYAALFGETLPKNQTLLPILEKVKNHARANLQFKTI